MSKLMDLVAPRLMPLLEPGEWPRVVFMGFNYDVATRDGGSQRIVVATDTHFVVVVTGVVRRTTPYRVEDRRPFSELRNPMFAWPGTTLYGEEVAEILPRIWVHRRYRPAVTEAYAMAVRAQA
ncbi:MAG: hypothetical protein HKO87_06645 [Acidimicrobiia bacterium]|nr:hypothetical protein [Deltaproteobacteria bacterium]NNK92095.1 hypothetical protein [Acidimicrobiia bacterium]